MKIAYIYDAVYPWVKGGGEKRVYELSRRLADRGHEVHCYGIKWWTGESTIAREGVHIHGICSPMNLYSGSRRSIKESAWFASNLLFSISKRFDVVDCQEFPYIPCFSAKLSTKLRSGELFLTWYEVWGKYWQSYLGNLGIIGVWTEKAISKLTKNNIAISEMTKRELETLGVENAWVLPIGVDFHKIDRLDASDLESDIIYVGRLVKHKNIDMLIRALALVKSNRHNIRAVIVGDGPESENLQILSKQLNLEKNVLFTGFMENHDDALALMKSSKIFVSPSTREGFGIAALEAKACGLPIITVNHKMNAVLDLLSDKTGLICDLNDDSLAQTISSLLERQKFMRISCMESAKEYDWARICNLAEDIYGSSES